MVVQNSVAPMPAWRGAVAYVSEFTPIHQLIFWPSLLLAPAFVALMACIHMYSPEERKVWSLTGLAVGVVYAAMASINYNIQLVAVRQSLLARESAGLEMFVQANPHSIFMSLANSYVYMCLAMFFSGQVFSDSGLERWRRSRFTRREWRRTGSRLPSALREGGRLLRVRCKHASRMRCWSHLW